MINVKEIRAEIAKRGIDPNLVPVLLNEVECLQKEVSDLRYELDDKDQIIANLRKRANETK